jgi:SAM-dependent methyltransferase
MEKLAPGKRLADIGAGPGYFCRVAAEEGWSATGIEISSEAVRYGQERLGVRYASLDQIPDASIDVISCQHVLEHVAAPSEFLRALRRKLAPSGLLVIHVPHEQPLTFLVREQLRRLLRRSRDTYCTLYGDIHISGFSSASLKKVVEREGFATHFIPTVGMWSRYYDPFFAREYLRHGKWVAFMRKGIRSGLELFGNPVGKGDWIVGYFIKSS